MSPLQSTSPVCSSDQRTIRTIRLTPVMTRRGVLLPHFERVFSWTLDMQRLEWKLDADGSLSAQHCGWVFRIALQCQQKYFWLCIEPTPGRGADWLKWYGAAYLQDAMAIAQAIASGASLS